MKNLQSRTKVRLLQSLLLISLSLFFLVNPAYAQGGFAVKGVIVDKTGCKRLRDSILSPFFHSYIFAMYKNEALWI